MNRKLYTLFAGLILLSLVLAACGGGIGGTTTVEVTRVVQVEVTREVQVAGTPEVKEVQVAVKFAEAGDTLKTIQDRGRLICGGNKSVPGFGYLVPETQQYAGFDIDYCKALAAAIFDDPEAVEIVPTTAQERFPKLQSGDIDVLIRNTTWTFTRDTANGFDFAPTTFYDGQGMMVLKDSGITDLEGLAGGTVCVQQGTTTETNLADVMAKLGVDFEPVVFPDADSTRQAYDEGRCDGFTTDKSGLISQQILLKEPAAHVILAETMSKEPLGPLVRHGDNNWGDVVGWVVYCTLQAEELGIDSTNVDDFLGSDDPAVLNTLGVTGELGLALGLSANFCERVVRHVGNYGEIYNRNLGPDTSTYIPRGVNELWTNGGLMYSPPFR